MDLKVIVGSECVLLKCLSSGWVYAIKDHAYFLLRCLIYTLPEINYILVTPNSRNYQEYIG